MKKALLITTINAPNKAIKLFTDGCQKHDIGFIVAGDKKTPGDFCSPGVHYLSPADQLLLFPQFAEKLPLNHYSRKNTAYLYALSKGATVLIESDDDNCPLDSFWDLDSDPSVVTTVSSEAQWYNAYRHFTEEKIWPRGLPLDYVLDATATSQIPSGKTLKDYRIVQGLADSNPDVDAIFRLTHKLPVSFSSSAKPIELSPGLWCPFNSQNTRFAKEVSPLCYLPSFCSFRMTDIWRSFVAQRCLWEMGEGVAFHTSTVYQDRNEHNLLRDFEDEIDGYLKNARIADLLAETKLSQDDLFENLYLCYETLVREQIFPQKELDLVQSWIETIHTLL